MLISTLVKMFKKEEKKETEEMEVSKHNMVVCIMNAMGFLHPIDNINLYSRLIARKTGVITRMYKQALVVLESEKR